jgi:hypothetical protein
LNGYSKVELLGKYSFLRPAFPSNPKTLKQLGLKNDPHYGFMFGAIGGAIEGAKLAVKRISLIYDMESGEKMILSKTNVLRLLDKFPDLKTEFISENNLESEDVLLKYLQKINDREKSLPG